MKKYLLFILICLTQNIFSQQTNNISNKQTITEEEDNQVYSTAGIDIKPEFPGGKIEFDKFIEQNFRLPTKNPELKGTIYASFVIEKDGSLSDIKILRDLGFKTGEEAIRVLKMSPKWKPAEKDYKTIRVQFSTPISVNNFTK